MNTFKSTQNIGDIVTIMPKASDIFKKYNIDFCCGGNRPLSQAIMEQNLNEAEILAKLNKTFEEAANQKRSGRDFNGMSPTELVDYIENTHHAYVKQALPEISELAAKILRVHGIKHEVLFKVHKLFHSLKTELEQHLIKEEEILFPMIREYDKRPENDTLGRIRSLVKETEDEHDAAGGILKELRKVTDQYEVPADSCNTYSMTYRKMEEFESDLFHPDSFDKVH